MVSFADVDIKFPHPAKRSHLFDADAVGVDITNDGMCCMKLLPGYIKSISLEHALACNNCKHLILSDPDHAESYALRAILKCTQGWHAPHELIERSVGALVLEDLATFEWNLFQFLRGHGHQERVLFLMNLRNLLTRHSASRDMIGIIERNFLFWDCRFWIRLWHFIRPIVTIVVVVRNRNRFVNSPLLYQLYAR